MIIPSWLLHPQTFFSFFCQQAGFWRQTYTDGKDVHLPSVSTSSLPPSVWRKAANLQSVANGSCLLSNMWPPRPSGVSQSGFISSTLTGPTPPSRTGRANAALLWGDSLRAGVSTWRKKLPQNLLPPFSPSSSSSSSQQIFPGQEVQSGWRLTCRLSQPIGVMLVHGDGLPTTCPKICTMTGRWWRARGSVCTLRSAALFALQRRDEDVKEYIWIMFLGSNAPHAGTAGLGLWQLKRYLGWPRLQFQVWRSTF